MSKKADNITGAHNDPDSLPLAPEAPPSRISSADVPPGVPAPRTARFGEGGEGAGARRERGVVGARAGLFERLAQFLHDVRSELRRVSWPSANDVKNTTIITVIAVIFFAVYLFAVDQGLAFFITQLERLVNWLVGSV
ncbi:MAG: preprotein translocase subunit SecE [Pyrinomonadaceae bacterium]